VVLKERPDLAHLRALLLDLDDTLLINDMEAFTRAYYPALVAKMSSHIPPALFTEALNAGIAAMWHNDGRDGTNLQVFVREFFARVNRTDTDIMPVFDEFYSLDFESLRVHTRPDPNARRLVTLARAHGYQIAIATQPVFPRSAVLARLRWANVPHREFAYDLVSSYEHMRACKPHPVFFASILERLGRAPDECLMVGDSIDTDLPARELGIRTFWVDRGQRVGANVSADARGTLGDLASLLETGGIHAL